jgi:hypothetical protein
MDIREILNALSPEDRQLWSQHRTEMRRSYLNAHNTTVGMVAWSANDDAFLDLIDIKLAMLFDQSGKLEATKDIIGKDDESRIETKILAESDAVKNKQVNMSNGTKALTSGWNT